jgi:hypothetical protein
VRLPDPGVPPVHARLRRTPDGGAAWVATGRAVPPRGEVVPIGPYVLEISFDDGAGPTSDRLDTGRRARQLAQELATAAGQGWTLWLADGSAVPVPAGRPLHLGDAPESPVRLRGVGPRHVTFRMEAGRLVVEAHGPGVVRNGAPLAGAAALEAGDTVEAGGVALRVSPPASRAGPRPQGWTRLERASVAVIVAATVAATLIFASAW